MAPGDVATAEQPVGRSFRRINIAVIRDYGVVVSGDPENDPEGLSIDAAATERARVERAA